jgi:hypothetical protein
MPRPGFPAHHFGTALFIPREKNESGQGLYKSAPRDFPQKYTEKIIAPTFKFDKSRGVSGNAPC